MERRDCQPCQPFTKDFWLQNSTPLTVTVTIGASAINLPAGWTYSTNITETVLGPYQGITVTVTITPPCGLAAQRGFDARKACWTPAAPAARRRSMWKATSDGELLGGIEIQLEGPLLNKIYLPHRAQAVTNVEWRVSTLSVAA